MWIWGPRKGSTWWKLTTGRNVSWTKGLWKSISPLRLVGWMVFYATFSIISVMSRRRFTLFMSFLGGALNSLARGHSHEKIQKIQCGSNPGPLDYESNTLPRSHAGPKSITEHYRNSHDHSRTNRRVSVISVVNITCSWSVWKPITQQWTSVFQKCHIHVVTSFRKCI